MRLPHEAEHQRRYDEPARHSSTSESILTNLRFRWEYAPGSEIFLVYTDERDRTEERFATPTLVRGLKNRAFVVKVNRLFRF